jgi:hypothetical protein
MSFKTSFHRYLMKSYQNQPCLRKNFTIIKNYVVNEVVNKNHQKTLKEKPKKAPKKNLKTSF